MIRAQFSRGGHRAELPGRPTHRGPERGQGRPTPGPLPAMSSGNLGTVAQPQPLHLASADEGEHAEGGVPTTPPGRLNLATRCRGKAIQGEKDRRALENAVQAAAPPVITRERTARGRPDPRVAVGGDPGSAGLETDAAIFLTSASDREGRHRVEFTSVRTARISGYLPHRDGRRRRFSLACCSERRPGSGRFRIDREPRTKRHDSSTKPPGTVGDAPGAAGSRSIP